MNNAHRLLSRTLNDTYAPTFANSANISYDPNGQRPSAEAIRGVSPDGEAIRGVSPDGVNSKVAGAPLRD